MSRGWVNDLSCRSRMMAELAKVLIFVCQLSDQKVAVDLVPTKKLSQIVAYRWC